MFSWSLLIEILTSFQKPLSTSQPHTPEGPRGWWGNLYCCSLPPCTGEGAFALPGTFPRHPQPPPRLSHINSGPVFKPKTNWALTCESSWGSLPQAWGVQAEAQPRTWGQWFLPLPRRTGTRSRSHPKSYSGNGNSTQKGLPLAFRQG